MLEGNAVNLQMAEREDIPLLMQWLNDVQLAGDYMNLPIRTSRADLERQVLEHRQYGAEWVYLMVEKKDGAKVGWAAHYVSAPNFGWNEIGYAIVPSERNSGYATEAARILVDYLFLTKEIMRVQAVPDVSNVASQRVLEKAGFTREGTLRKALWNAAGEWADAYVYGIIREEWNAPKVLDRPKQPSRRA
jgi:RimJ/RimL family protein N-acetyltransferase